MIETLLKEKKVLIGMVHLPPLPGSPMYDGASTEQIRERMSADCSALVDAGFDAVSFSNEGDAPFLSAAPLETAVLATRLVFEASRGLTVPYGFGFLVDARATLAIANAVSADFVRISFGVTAGMFGVSEAPPGELLRYRAQIGATGVQMLMNVSPHLATSLDTRPFIEQVKGYVHMVKPAAVQVHGPAAGAAPTVAEVAEVKQAVGDVPVVTASGTTVDSIGDFLQVSDGVIVGTSLKYDSDIFAPVEASRARAFVEMARKVK